MINFEKIKKEYGHRGSWAIWQKRDETKKAKFGMGVTTFFDNPESLPLNPNIILCGLNISKKIKTPFSNFHPSHSTAHDYKIRYALEYTLFWGAYMTDIIKDYEEVISGKVMSYLRKNQEFEKENIASFEEELKCIGTTNPIIIAFGNDCFKILNKHFKNKYTIYKVPHYSSNISKEKLRLKFNEISKKIKI